MKLISFKIGENFLKKIIEIKYIFFGLNKTYNSIRSIKLISFMNGKPKNIPYAFKININQYLSYYKRITKVIQLIKKYKKESIEFWHKSKISIFLFRNAQCICDSY